MNLTTAEKTLIAIINEPLTPFNQEDKTAILLGIQALRMIEQGRSKPGGMFFHDLPGETK